MVAWDKICRPKKLGGLGLRKTSAINTAFVAKLSWKFLTQSNNYWVQQMRVKYCSPNSFSSIRKNSLIHGLESVYFVLEILLNKVCNGN